MPGGDRTGPSGMGPMTGRKMGLCSGDTVPGYANRFPVGAGARGNRAFGRGGGGGGRGWRNWYHATGLPGYIRSARGMPAWGRPAVQDMNTDAPGPSTAGELDMLKAQSKQLAESLKEIEKRIEELKSD
jgi:hypothetical protein